ncbi:MAG: phosphomannomutase/phosphoglucomutase [bacterium]|nr:phosphomannomutase/phosphoglucomutase [bacterium]
MKAFKAYDIRGIYGTELTDDIAYQVGRCLPKLLNAKRILIGRDARRSSPALRAALVRGLNEAGAMVEDMGLATTPMVYFFTAEKGYDASIMITASHNPGEYNGLKVSKTGALPVSYHLGLNQVEAMIEANALPPPAITPGTCQTVTYQDEYIQWMRQHLPTITGLRFAIDCSDGSAGLIAREIFGDTAIYLNDSPNGDFPHHGPNPLEIENCQQLIDVVKTQNLDLGLIFDGDADRVMCIDNNGEFVQPDTLIPLFAQLLRSKSDPQDIAVVHDIRTSRGVIETIQAYGFTPVMVKVGAAFAKTELRQRQGLCGGEVAGHYYYRDFHWCDSGIFAAVHALTLAVQAKSAGSTFAERITPIATRYHRSGEVNVHNIDNRQAAIERVETALVKLLGQPETRVDFDGVRLDWRDAWFGVRASNTEPILRLAAEAKALPQLQTMLAIAQAAAQPS